WWVNGKKPDAYVEGLLPDRPAVIEIASTNDNSISGEADMDWCSQEIIKFADSVQKGSGQYLYFTFAETRRYEKGRHIRGIASPREYTLSQVAKSSIKHWLLSQERQSTTLCIDDQGLRVDIVRKE